MGRGRDDQPVVAVFVVVVADLVRADASPERMAKARPAASGPVTAATGRTRI